MKRSEIPAFAAAVLAAGAAAASETVTYTYDPLGRLIAVQHMGAVNDGRADSLCYDPAGNRALYKSSAAGALADCATAPAPPANQPPVAAPDFLTAPKCQQRTVDVIANDSDPEGDAPLTLASVTSDWARLGAGGVVLITTPDTNGNYPIAYTVTDSLGASAGGILTLTVTGGQQCA